MMILTTKKVKMTTRNFLIFTLIVLNFFHFPMHASYERQAEICSTVTFEDSNIYPWGVEVNFKDEWNEWKIIDVVPQQQA
jgi:hypothetical protein